MRGEGWGLKGLRVRGWGLGIRGWEVPVRMMRVACSLRTSAAGANEGESCDLGRRRSKKSFLGSKLVGLTSRHPKPLQIHSGFSV